MHTGMHFIASLKFANWMLSSTTATTTITIGKSTSSSPTRRDYPNCPIDPIPAMRRGGEGDLSCHPRFVKIHTQRLKIRLGGKYGRLSSSPKSFNERNCSAFLGNKWVPSIYLIYVHRPRIIINHNLKVESSGLLCT